MNRSPAITIRLYMTRDGRVPFLDWLQKLTGPIGDRIDLRLARVRDGNLGDYRDLGGGLYELRTFFGPGYRIYFARQGATIVILLAGGTKGTQRRDIRRARRFLEDYQEQGHASNY